MYLLVGLAILGSAFAVPLVEVQPKVDTRNDDLAALYVLPGESYPTFYDVRLFIDPSNTAYFFGNVSIRVIPRVATQEIVLHAMEMVLDDISAFTDSAPTDNLFSNFSLATDDTHLLRVRFTRNLVALQPITVNINYVAQYAENMFGVYVSSYNRSSYETVNLVTSQLQPTFARRAFPCYDEPAQKAIFRTTIYASPYYPVVRSNTVERSIPLKQDVAGYNKFEFEDTLLMSTYLIAYLVSDFTYVENNQNPIYNLPFRVYSRPGTEDTAQFALDFGQRSMVALENYTEFPYAFPKIDKAAVPDFAAGAMENWGLVIYREVALLVRDGITTTATKQNIGRIITHENVHMWYGNEVGPQSWTYTWLNEGFANFFENYATDLVLPEWRMMDQYVIALQNVFQADAVLSVNPMTYGVYTPSQILGTFNAVAYQKSGSVIRMMQHFLTPDIFRRGLVRYIRNNSRRAASPPDLYAALQEELSISTSHSIPYQLATVMDRWTNQGGFPVLTVRRSAPGANSLSIAQERFLTDRSQSSSDRWHVPINWVLSTNVDFTDTSPQGWVSPVGPAVSFNIEGLSNAAWYIVNKQQTGYYRVNYDNDNWAALANVLNSSFNTIHLLNRAQIIDDSFNLARSGRLEYNYPFEISQYLVQEKDYIPWAAADAAFSYLDVVLSDTTVYNLFQQYLLELSAPLYAELGFTASSDDEHVMAFHRNIILGLNCRHGNQICIETAGNLLQSFANNQENNRLNPDIQTIVYCSSLRGGSADNFNFLWSLYAASTDSSEQAILLNALGCTSNIENRTFYLNQVISETSLVRDQDRHTILVSVINSSPENRDAALDFILENFAGIQPNVQGLTGTTNILNALSRTLTSQEHLNKINEFVTRYQNIFTAGEQASIAAIRENIAASITWNSDNLDKVTTWLNAYYDNGATVVTSSFIILVSMIVTIFNY